MFCCETKDDSKFEPKVWIFWLENRSGENLREGIEELFFFFEITFHWIDVEIVDGTSMFQNYCCQSGFYARFF